MVHEGAFPVTEVPETEQFEAFPFDDERMEDEA